MSTKVEGVVGVIMESKFGKGEWRLKLNDVDQWFNVAKRYEGVLEQGNRVGVKYEQKGKNAAVLGVKLVEAGTPVQPNAAAGQSREGYWTEKEARDIARELHQRDVIEPRTQYANARDHAIRVVELLLVNGAVALPAATKRAEREIEILGRIDDLTVRFFGDADAQGAIGRVQAEKEPYDTAPEDEPQDALDDDTDELE